MPEYRKLELLIGGKPTYLWDVMGWHVSDTYGPGGDTALIKFPAYSFGPGLPKLDQEALIRFTNSSNVVSTIFKGLVQERQAIPINKDDYEVMLDCISYMKQFDSKLLNNVFTQATIPALLAAMLSDTVNRNGVTVFTQAGVTLIGPVFPQSFDLVTLSEGIQRVADMVQAIWDIDIDSKDLTFVSLFNSAIQAPVVFVNFDTNLNIVLIEFKEDTSNIINSLVVRDFTYKGDTTIYEPGNLTLVGWGHELGDAIKTVFYLAYEVNQLTDLTVEVSINSGANWTLYNLRQDLAESVPGSGSGNPLDAFVNTKDRFVRFAVPPASSSWVRFSYKAALRQPFTTNFQDVWSILDRKRLEGGDGIYQKAMAFQDAQYLVTAGVDPLQALAAIATAKLRIYAWPVVTGKFVVFSDHKTGWHAGQYMRLRSDKVGLYDRPTYAKSGVKVPMSAWLTRVEITPETPFTLRYECTFSSVPRGSL